LGLFSLDIAIDLGTANTLVHVRGKGIVINEPSWVTIDKRSRHPLAIGLEAKEMMGRTPSNVAVIRPLRDGVISEFDITQVMLEYFIGRVHEQSVVPLPRPRVVVGIPTGVTEVEKRAVYDAVMASGARSAFLIEEPIAAALGAGLPLADVKGSMVVVSAGTTEVAVVHERCGCFVRCVAGDEMDQDVFQYLEQIQPAGGEGIAEQIKWKIGSAYPLQPEKTMEVRGRNLVTGLPESIEVSSVEIREALSASVQVIVDTIRDALDEIPPEIVADLMDIGICLAGGGGLLQGLADRLTDELKLRVWVASPLYLCGMRCWHGI
jgi:rod shape-determining protein MreB